MAATKKPTTPTTQTTNVATTAPNTPTVPTVPSSDVGVTIKLFGRRKTEQKGVVGQKLKEILSDVSDFKTFQYRDKQNDRPVSLDRVINESMELEVLDKVWAG
jgi:hypothetical protein